MKQIGPLLKKLREERELTQQALADKLGIKQGVYTFWETSKRVPSAENLIRLADFYECSVDYILCRESDLGYIEIHIDGEMLTVPEKELLDIYRKLTPHAQSRLTDFASTVSVDEG